MTFSFKHLLLAATMLMTGATASALEITSADPESGSTVESLSKVLLKTDKRYADKNWEYELTNTIVYDKLRNAVCCVDITQGDEYGDIELTFKDIEATIDPNWGWAMRAAHPLTEAGTYMFTIPANSILNDGDESDGNAEYTYMITITGNGETPGPGDETGPEASITLVKADPASGATVKCLDLGGLYFNVGLYFSMEGILDCDKITIHKGTADGETLGSVYEGDIDWNDPTHFNIVCEGDFVKGETYVVVIEEGAILNEDDMQNPKVNAKVELTYTIQKDEVVDPGTGLTVKSTTPANNAALVCDNGKTLQTWNVTFSETVSVADETKLPVITCSDGNSWTGSYNTNMQNFGAEFKGMVVCRDFFGDKDDKQLPSGTYTLTIPAGALRGASGNLNDEVTVSVNWTQSADYGNNDPKEDNTPLELVDVKIVKANGETIDLLNTKELDGFGKDSKIRILTNKASDETVRALHLSLYDEADEENVIWSGWTYTTGVTATQTVTVNGKKDDGYFEFTYYQTDEFLKGHNYVLNISAWNKYDGVPETERVSRGASQVKFEGNVAAYEYADIDILSITPAPDGEIDDIDNANVVIKFARPVEILQYSKTGQLITGVQRGQMGVAAMTDVKSNGDGTIWTLVLPKSELENMNGSLPIIFAAQSLDGKRVRCESYTQSGIENFGEKDNAYQSVSYTCYLGAAEMNVTPVSGSTVEKLYSFKFDKGGSNIDYQGINAKGQRVFPKLLSTTGAVLANMVYTDDEIVRESTSTGTDDKVLSVTMHLDREITAPGKYILYVPSVCFVMGSEYSASMNRPMRLEYIIEGDYEVAAASIENGSNVKELGVVSLYITDDVKLADDAKMVLRRKGATRTVKEVALNAVNYGAYTRIDADFADSDNAFAPFVVPASDDNKEFELLVAKGSMTNADGAPYAEKLISFVSTDEYVPQTVALSMNVAGHVSSVQNVHKGSTVKVNLVPAEGWKLDYLKLNGNDVTSEVAANAYVTPALNADAELEANYKFDGVLTFGSGVLELPGSSINIQVVDGKILVKGLANGDVINVYSLGGSLMASRVADEESIVINLVKGTYVVTFNGRDAVKVIL